MRNKHSLTLNTTSNMQLELARLRRIMGEGALGTGRGQLAVAVMFWFSTLVDTFRFSTYSGAGNVPYIVILNYPELTRKEIEKYE